MKRRATALLLCIGFLISVLAGCKIEFPDDVADSGLEVSSVSSSVEGIDPDDLLPQVSSQEEMSQAGQAVSSSPSSEGSRQEGGTGKSSAAVFQAPASTTQSKDAYQTDPVPSDKPKPVEPQDTEINEQKKLTCNISIRCDTILDNMEDLAAGKEGLVPADGIILSTQTVEFSEGESVFDVLLRETKRRRIHMEFVDTPMYNSAYIEGINNLYEKDCGSESGWMYKVNGWFPNYGCSRYPLKDGDVVEWVYTCDLGRDVGNEWSGDWQK